MFSLEMVFEIIESFEYHSGHGTIPLRTYLGEIVHNLVEAQNASEGMMKMWMNTSMSRDVTREATRSR